MSTDVAPTKGPATLLNRQVLQRQSAVLPLPARTEALLAGKPPGPGPLDVACVGASLIARQVADALARDEATERAFCEWVAASSGLGPGLTPTGDDLLMALLVAGRHLASGGLIHETALARLGRAVMSSPRGRTTPAAERLLQEACAGHAPSPLARFVEALGRPEVTDDDLAKRCACLVATGAHSGADWLAGVLALTARCCESSDPGPTSIAMTTSHAVTGGTPTIQAISLPAAPGPLFSGVTP